jgi:hypothetical protein
MVNDLLIYYFYLLFSQQNVRFVAKKINNEKNIFIGFKLA